MARDEELRRIGDRADWSARQNADYAKLWWPSRRIIDLLLRYPRVINWVRLRKAHEPNTRIGRARQMERERTREVGTSER
jgi:hypothetical protein